MSLYDIMHSVCEEHLLRCCNEEVRFQMASTAHTHIHTSVVSLLSSDVSHPTSMIQCTHTPLEDCDLIEIIICTLVGLLHTVFIRMASNVEAGGQVR